MWAITSYYNPIGYKRRLSNYRIFRANLCVPLVTVELSFDGRFELTKTDADILIQICGGALLWQKERLLNLAIKSVPADVENIAWLDCDIIFETSDWAREAKEHLARLNVIQLFADAIEVDSENYALDCKGPVAVVEGIINLLTANELMPLDGGAQRKTKVGLAWAAKRKLLEDHGFYDTLIVGGGDRSMVGAIYGQFDNVIKQQYLNAARQEHYLAWAHSFHKSVGKRVGHIAGRMRHLRHGHFENRNYFQRHYWLSKFDFNPNSDLVVGANGAWQWAKPRPELQEFLKNFFINRAEDD